MVVDRALARGLADRVLAELARNSAEYREASFRVVREIPHRRGDVERKASELVRIGEANFMTQILGNHPKWRWLQLTSFLPTLCRIAENGADNRTIFYSVIRFYLHVDRRPLGDVECPILLGLQEHAVERLFQRLNVLSAASVHEEIHDAMCLSVPMWTACRTLGLAQVALPTRSGAFLCSVGEGGSLVLAKTWLSRDDMQSRHRGVVDAVKDHYLGSGGERGVAETLVTVPVTVPLKEFPSPDGLCRVLDRFKWLREEYRPRPDPEGEVWRKASQQASTQHA